MKLATLKDSTRDGRLVVVSKDLATCSEVGHIARTLQAALDDWEHAGPRLERVAEGLETGAQPSLRFHEHAAASPLPRAYQWIEGTLGEGRGPGLRRRGSDSFNGPRDSIRTGSGTEDIIVNAGLAVIVDDVVMGASPDEAAASILLVLLVHGVKEQGADAADLVSSFSPVAVTPEALGDAWHGSKVSLPLLVGRNGTIVAKPNAAGVRFDFAQLISHAARNRPLSAGTIIGAGPLPDDEYSSVSIGQTLRLEMKDKSGHSIFGAIEQVVEAGA